MLRLALIILIGFMGFSCKKSANRTDSEADAVVRFQNKTLFVDDLPADLFLKHQLSDSGVVIKNYAQDWLKKHILLEKAEENITNRSAIDNLVEEYRKSLIIYEYQKAYLDERLDTNVSNKDIEVYYQKYTENFKLRTPIVRLRFIKFDKESPLNDNVKKWFLSDVSNDKIKLIDFCNKYAVNSFFDNNVWLRLSDLFKEIPFNEAAERQIIDERGFVEIKDDSFIYWLYIVASRDKADNSPLEFEKDKIRTILLNKRKLKLLNAMEDALYNAANDNKNITWYLE
jgi:hypothetical protein